MYPQLNQPPLNHVLQSHMATQCHLVGGSAGVERDSGLNQLLLKNILLCTFYKIRCPCEHSAMALSGHEKGPMQIRHLKFKLHSLKSNSAHHSLYVH